MYAPIINKLVNQDHVLFDIQKGNLFEDISRILLDAEDFDADRFPDCIPRPVHTSNHKADYGIDLMKIDDESRIIYLIQNKYYTNTITPRDYLTAVCAYSLFRAINIREEYKLVFVIATNIIDVANVKTSVLLPRLKEEHAKIISNDAAKQKYNEVDRYTQAFMYILANGIGVIKESVNSMKTILHYLNKIGIHPKNGSYKDALDDPTLHGLTENYFRAIVETTLSLSNSAEKLKPIPTHLQSAYARRKHYELQCLQMNINHIDAKSGLLATSGEKGNAIMFLQIPDICTYRILQDTINEFNEHILNYSHSQRQIMRGFEIAFRGIMDQENTINRLGLEAYGERQSKTSNIVITISAILAAMVILIVLILICHFISRNRYNIYGKID